MKAPEGADLEVYTDQGAFRCQAYLSDGTRQCSRASSRGSEFCRAHGAKGVKDRAKRKADLAKRDPTAIASGRYDASLPKKLLRTYSKSLTDPDLLSLNDEIALIDSRTAELIETLQDNPAPDFPALLKQVDRLIRRFGDDDVLASELQMLKETMTGAYARDSAWEKIKDMIKTRAFVADAERKRRSDLQGYLTAKQVLGLAGQLVDLAARRMTDDSSRRAFADDIKKVMGGSYVTSGDTDEKTLEILYEEDAKEDVERRHEELAGKRGNGSK